MDRFTKIVLEQLKRGDYETARASTKMLQAVDQSYGTGDVFAFRVRPKRNQEYSKFKIPSDLPRTNRGRTYSIEGYIFVIGKEEILKKEIQQWPIYVYKLENIPLNSIDAKILNSKKIGMANKALVFDIETFNKLNQQVVDTDLEYEKAKKDQAITQAIQTDKNPELKAKLTIDPTDSVVMELLIKDNMLPHIYNIFKFNDKLSDFQAIKQRKYISYRKTAVEQKKFVEDQVNYDKYIRMIQNIKGINVADKIVRQMLKKHYNQVTENYFKNIGLDKSLKDIIKEIIN